MINLRSILIILCLLLCLNIFAESNTQETASPFKPSIAVLPFFNYTGSEAGYLSGYIPELITERLKGSKILHTVMDTKQVIQHASSASPNLTRGKLFDETSVIRFLKTLNVSHGVAGRYIIEGNIIRINYYLVNVGSGKVTKGIDYEGIADENLLTIVDAFAKETTDWITAAVKSGAEGAPAQKSIFSLDRILNTIRDSKVGFIVKNKWGHSLLILIFFIFLSWMIVLFIEKVLRRISARTKTDVDDKLIGLSKKPLKWIVRLIGVRTALLPLQLSSSLSGLLNNIVFALIVLFITKIALQGSSILLLAWGKKVAKKMDSRINDDLVPLFSKITRILILIVAGLLIFSKFGVKVGPLVASLGIAGFAIGFAMKDSLANLVGGFILMLDKSFVVGDKVTIDSHTGTIEDIGLRNTRIKTFDNEIIIIPNGELMNKSFKNFVLPDPTIRVVVNFGVAYGTKIDHVEKVIMDVISNIEGVVKEPEPQVVFREMADFSLNFQAKFWITEYTNQYKKKWEATKKSYNALNKAKINIPFPTHTVYVEK
jgi:MscS family membrane protein